MINIKIKNRILLYLVFVVVGLIVPQVTQAVTVSPVLNEVEAEAGTTVERDILLSNEKRESKTLFLDFLSFEAKDESGKPLLFRARTGLPTWMSSEYDSVTLGAGEKRNIKVQIAVPKDAEPGGYFAAVMFRDEPIRQIGDESAVALSSQVGSLMLLRVKGDLEAGGDILEFKTVNSRKFFKSLPVDFYYRFQNSGNSWVKPLGDIVIENMWGGTTKIINANSEGANILPRSIRRLEAGWLSRKGEIESKESERLQMPEGFWQRVRFQMKNSPLGRFNARLTLTYGDNHEKNTTKEYSFWILPVELLSVAVPSGIFALILLRLGVKFYNRRVIRKALEQKQRARARRKKVPTNED